MKASAPVPPPPPSADVERVPTGNRLFFLQSTLTSYEVEELSGWQLATILSELPRLDGTPDAPAGGSSGD